MGVVVAKMIDGGMEGGLGGGGKDLIVTLKVEAGVSGYRIW